MKKKLFTHLAIIACSFSFVITLNAQSSHVVPNPNAPGLFAWTSGSLSGYAGNPIILNNSLVLEYNATSTSDVTQIKLQLAVYTGGDSLHLIPNPDGGQGVYFQSVQIVFNNKLFIIYLDASGVQRLASFDGTSITLYPNPDAAGVGTGYVGSPRILNNSLYVAYVNASGVTQFGKFNGSGITLIPNPDNSSVGFFNDYAVVFNNKIVSRYVTATGPKQLANFDGTSWTLVPNPDNTPNHGFQPIFPTNYHNKLYWIYYGIGNQYQYAVYDGTTNPTLIANPQNSSSNNGGVAGFPIVYNDTLFFQYYNTSNVLQLAKTGGSSVSFVPNPDNTTYGFWNTPIVYNNNLYIFYLPVDGTHHIAEYQTASNSLKVFPNPDGGLGYWDQPIVYDNHLYFIYNNAQSKFQVGYFGGNSIKLISNPPGIYNGASGNNGYTGYPLIWNNLLYMQFGSVPYGNAGNLAFIDGSALPVTLLNLQAKYISANNTEVSWQTSSEENNKGFEVYRSTDGTNFSKIGFVKGAVNSNVLLNYNYVDNAGLTGKIFYKLKQLDEDGNGKYSDVVYVITSKQNVITFSPNPANDFVTIISSEKIKEINLVNINGQSVKKWNNISPNDKLDVSNISKGVYFLKFANGDSVQSQKLIKE